MHTWISALWLTLAGPAGQGMTMGKPTHVVLGESIASVRLGMSLAKVRSLGFAFRPEGVVRATGAGWIAGPLLVIVDDQERVMTVSFDLRKSAGVMVGETLISKQATLDEIARALPHCMLEKGSGGRALVCKSADGRITNFYDSYMGNDLWVIMP